MYRQKGSQSVPGKDMKVGQADIQSAMVDGVFRLIYGSSNTGSVCNNEVM